MRVDELIQHELMLEKYGIDIIQYNCSQFIDESRGVPVYKALPDSYPDIHKVKARLRKKSDSVTSMFNTAFEQEAPNLRQRSIVTNAEPPLLTEDTDLFYVLPINNYKFLYSHEVTDSNNDYKHVINTLLEAFDDANKASEMVTDLLKFSYSTQNLYEGITANAEIIFYGIPFYYAIRVDAWDYDQIIK